MLLVDRGQVRTLHGHRTFPRAAIAALAHVYTTSTGISPHGHDFVEIAVIGGGTGRHVTAQGSTPVRTGDVLVLRPGAWHQFTDCHDLVVADTCVATTVLQDDIAVLHEIPAIRSLVWRGPAETGRFGVYATHVPEDTVRDVVTAVAALADALAHSPHNRALLLGRLLAIFGALVDHLPHDPEPRAVHTGVAAVLDQLNAAPERHWRLDDLAAVANLDRAYLSRLFRRHVGVSPLAYQARIRAERAASLLTRTDEPVARIGARVGWPDPAYFARRFREFAGLSPTAYRRRFTTPGAAAQVPCSDPERTP